jgi:ATP-binding cassette subfamily G (WHITE) protein 2
VINSFPSERLLVLRERAAGTYYASAYFMAKITADFTTQLPIPLIFSAIVYWLVGLQPSAEKFFIFSGFMVLCNLAGEVGAYSCNLVCIADAYIALKPVNDLMPAAAGILRAQQVPIMLAWLSAAQSRLGSCT